VEINRASYEQLIRIPGIGKVLAQRIITVRQENRITELSVLKKLGLAAKKATPFILLNGKKQGKIEDLKLIEQLPLQI
jgi:predicted DNA-binding helix-hairpin-helix protein